MIKNGLFLMSIGFLMILYVTNPTTLKYDFLLLTCALFFIVFGGIIFRKGLKQQKKETKEKEDMINGDK